MKRAARPAAVPETIDEYLAGVPEPARGTLKKLRATIRAAAPKGASETISYRIPAFKYKGILVWFAAFADHCSFFPTTSIIAAFKDELKGFPTSKGTIHFPPDKPLPTALVRKMVKARVAQNEAKRQRWGSSPVIPVKPARRPMSSRSSVYYLFSKSTGSRTSVTRKYLASAG